MFRRFPVYQRLISWTKPDAPFARGTREYEWYDHNSLVGDEPSATRRSRRTSWTAPSTSRPVREMEARSPSSPRAAAFASATAASGSRPASEDATASCSSRPTASTAAARACSRSAMTEPWKPPIPGLEEAPHYARHAPPERYEGKSVFIVGKRNSGFEVAQGLLPWARRIVLASPRPVDTAVLAFSPLRLRYLAAVRRARARRLRGATSSTPRSSASSGTRTGTASARAARRGRASSCSRADEVIAATGFPRAPAATSRASASRRSTTDGCRPRRRTGRASRCRASTSPGNVTQASPGLRKHGATSSSSSVNGFRYNARVLARHIAEKHFGLARRERPALARDEVVPYLAATSSRTRPSSGSRRATSRASSPSTRRTASATRASCRSRSSSTTATATRARSRSSTTPAAQSSPRCTSARRPPRGARPAAAPAARVRRGRLPGGARRASRPAPRLGRSVRHRLST